MSGINEKCRCGQPADFECTSRQVGERRIERRGGQDVIVQPYNTFYLCAACTRAAIASDDPPHGAKALPHHAAILRRETAQAAKALIGNVEEVRLGDWGKAS